jgi:hypothetical protein
MHLMSRHNQIAGDTEGERDRQKQTGRVANRTERQIPVHLPLLRMRELFRICVEFVETFAWAESILMSGEDLGITTAWLHLHSAHGIFRRSSRAWRSSHSVMSLVVLMAMDHVRAAPETHHEIKERRKQKE